jgi:hypothetical protein
MLSRPTQSTSELSVEIDSVNSYAARSSSVLHQDEGSLGPTPNIDWGTWEQLFGGQGGVDLDFLFHTPN